MYELIGFKFHKCEMAYFFPPKKCGLRSRNVNQVSFFFPDCYRVLTVFFSVLNINYMVFISGLKIFAENLVDMALLLMYMSPLITTHDVPEDLHMFNILSSLNWVMRENVLNKDCVRGNCTQHKLL